MNRAIVVIVLAALGAPARAESSDDGKHEGVALGLSAGGTAVSIGLMIAAARRAGDREADGLAIASLATMVIGPSLGHWYAGEYLTTGLAVRAAGTGLVVAGVVASGDDGMYGIIAGTGVIISGALWDIATAPRAAERWNRAHLELQPALVSTGGRATPGLGLGGSF